jgi:hypothetical protein
VDSNHFLTIVTAAVEFPSLGESVLTSVVSDIKDLVSLFFSSEASPL